MIAVIQCAATKRPFAGHLCTTSGRPIFFVADPGRAPRRADGEYARPDDPSDQGPSWRELLLQYNDAAGENPLGLLPAFELYANDVYRRLTERVGIERTYVLSAGWGLIGAAFLTPLYDITFSLAAAPYKRRTRTQDFRDFCMLPVDTRQPIVFFGGKDYVPLFAKLTQSVSVPRIVFYNSSIAPSAPGCSLRRFETAMRTNWHYECVAAFLDGRLDVSQTSDIT